MVRHLNLREELVARECLFEAEPYIKPCFRLAVEALRPHPDNLLKLAMRLFEQGELVLRPEDLDFFDGNAFVLSVAKMLGEDILEQIKQKLSTAATPQSDNTPAQAPEPDARIG